MHISLPTGYTSGQGRLSDHTKIIVRHVDSGDLVYNCSLHKLPCTDIVYPVAPVMSLAPDHREALPDLKLRMLEHFLHQHQVILMSAGNETAGGRFSFQTQLEYCMSRGYNAYELTGTQITRFDVKALHDALARPWTERLQFVLLSEHELPLNVTYEIPVDYVHSLDKLDARASLED